MRSLVTQVNDFSRKRLLIKLMPLMIGLTTISYLLNYNILFVNLLTLIFLFWLIHPDLIDFEQEKNKYLKSCQEIINFKKQTLRKYRKTKPLDLTRSRYQLLNLKRAILEAEEMLEKNKEADLYREFCLNFQRDKKRKICQLNQQAISQKRSTIKYLEREIKELESLIKIPS